MTYALSLILWMATTQTAAQPAAVPAAVPVATPAAAPTAAAAAAPSAPPAATPVAVVVQCPPSEAERMLRAQLEEARGQLDEARGQLKAARREVADERKRSAKLKEESGMPDHAVAALLVSDHPDLAQLEMVSVQPAGGAGMGRIRYAEAEVYVSHRRRETMAAVVLTLRNPREAPTWEPKEAFITTPYYRGDPPVPVAVRSSPERIRPGETARIAVVFNLQDLRLDEPYATLTLLRDGKWEMESQLHPSYFQAAAAISGGDQ